MTPATDDKVVLCPCLISAINHPFSGNSGGVDIHLLAERVRLRNGPAVLDQALHMKFNRLADQFRRVGRCSGGSTG